MQRGLRALIARGGAAGGLESGALAGITTCSVPRLRSNSSCECLGSKERLPFLISCSRYFSPAELREQ